MPYGYCVSIYLVCLTCNVFCLAVSNNNQHSKNVCVFVFNFQLPNTNCHHPVACSIIQSNFAFGFLTTVCLSDINLAMDLANEDACFSKCLKGSWSFLEKIAMDKLMKSAWRHRSSLMPCILSASCCSFVLSFLF